MERKRTTRFSKPQKCLCKQLCSPYPRLVKAIHNENRCIRICIGSSYHAGTWRWYSPDSLSFTKPTPRRKNYNAHDKELVGVVFGFKCGRPFFLGAQHPIIVRTDHKNLQYFREPHKINGHQARWLEFLQDFYYQLEHIPGSSNMITNLLSHRKDLNKGVNMEEPRILLPDTLFSPTTLWKIFLEDNNITRQNALWEIHDSQAGGHPGIANTWELIRQHYEGPRLGEFVEEYVKGCAKCQESKTNLPQRKAPLQRFDVPASEGPFQYMSMDLITDLPRSDGFDSILTIVDQGCSKATKFIPCHKLINGPGVALKYLKYLVP